MKLPSVPKLLGGVGAYLGTLWLLAHFHAPLDICCATALVGLWPLLRGLWRHKKSQS